MVVRPLDHTADVGFELEAKDLEDLFQAALKGLLEVMFLHPPRGGRKRKRLVLKAEDLETLLVRFLNELIYLIQTKGFVPGQAELEVEREDGATALGPPCGANLSRKALAFKGR